jgi:hypothetical protein
MLRARWAVQLPAKASNPLKAATDWLLAGHIRWRVQCSVWQHTSGF